MLKAAFKRELLVETVRSGKSPLEGIGYRWRGVLWHLLAVLTVVGFYLFFDEDAGKTLGFGGAVCLITYVSLGIREAKRSSLWLTPLSFYLLWYSNSLGLSALYLSTEMSEGVWLPFAASAVAPLDITKGYLIFLVGSVCLHAGMQLARPDKIVTLEMRETDSPRMKTWLCVGMWFLGLIIAFAPTYAARIGSPAAIFRGGTLAGVAALVFIGRERLQISRFTFVALVCLGNCGLFLVNLMTGSKAYVMYTFFPVFWACIAYPRLRKWLLIIAPGLAIIYLALVAPVIMASRLLDERRDESQVERIIRGYDEMLSGHFGGAPNEMLADNIDAYLRRQFDPIAVGYLLQDIRMSDYANDDLLERYLTAIIPRVIWPEKPEVTRGAWFAAYTGAAPSEEEATLSLGITAIGDWYWVYGITGVILGMFLIGALFGKLWNMAGENPQQQPVALLLYCNLMLTMPDMPDAVTVLVSITINFVVFKFLMGILGSRHRHSLFAHATTS